MNLAVALIQLFTGPGYRGPFRPFVTGYVIDICLPFAVYFLLAMNDERIPILGPWIVKSAVTFSVMSSAEVLQYIGTPAFGATYDPWDFVAYASAALLAASVERIVFARIFGFWDARHLTMGPRHESRGV